MWKTDNHGNHFRWSAVEKLKTQLLNEIISLCMHSNQNHIATNKQTYVSVCRCWSHIYNHRHCFRKWHTINIWNPILLRKLSSGCWLTYSSNWHIPMLSDIILNGSVHSCGEGGLSFINRKTFWWFDTKAYTITYMI